MSSKSRAAKILEQVRGQRASGLLLLYTAQAFRGIQPLIVIPAIARVAGEQGLAIFMYTLTVGSVLTMCVEYGFGINATRDAAKVAHCRESLTKIFTRVLISQSLISVGFAIVSVIALLYLLDKNADSKLITYAVLAHAALGMLPFWYLRAVREYRTIVLIDIISKLIVVAVVLIGVHSTDDFYLIFMGQLFGVLLGFFYFFRSSGVALAVSELTMGNVQRTLSSGWAYFTMRLGGTLLIDGALLAYGYRAKPEEFGLFSACFRLINASRNLLNPIVDFFMPRVSRLHAQNRDIEGPLLASALVATLVGGMVLILFGLGSGALAELYLGESIIGGARILQALAAFPLVVAINLVLASIWLVGVNETSGINRIIFFWACCCMATIMFVPTPSGMHEPVFMALAIVVTQCLLLVSFVLKLIFFYRH